MNESLQLIAVLAIVSLATAFLLRRAWRKHRGQAPACGSCDACQRKSR
mgnify:CR=1 FL=1